MVVKSSASSTLVKLSCVSLAPPPCPSPLVTHRIIIIIALTVLQRGQEVGRMLGNPQQLEILKVGPGQPSSNGYDSYRPQQNTPAAGMGYQQHQPQPQSTAPPSRSAGGTMRSSSGGAFYAGGGGGGPKTPTRTAGMPGIRNTSPSQRNIFPINSLNPYQSRWTIRARVTAKPPMRTYSNSRGEGKVMSVDLLDESVSVQPRKCEGGEVCFALCSFSSKTA